MKKVILKLGLDDTDKSRKKAWKKVSGLSGVNSCSMGSTDNKLTVTVTGDMDPIDLGIKFRKLCHTEMVSVGPVTGERRDQERRA